MNVAMRAMLLLKIARGQHDQATARRPDLGL